MCAQQLLLHTHAIDMFQDQGFWKQRSFKMELLGASFWSFWKRHFGASGSSILELPEAPFGSPKAQKLRSSKTKLPASKWSFSFSSFSKRASRKPRVASWWSVCYFFLTRGQEGCPHFSRLKTPDTGKCEGAEMPEDDLRAALSKGESWPKCFAKHQEARKSMAERLGVEAVCCCCCHVMNVKDKWD